MASDDDVQHLIITGVEIGGRELGRGAFGTVFEADYNGTTCAAKEIHSILQKETLALTVNEQLKSDFLRECLTHSKLVHPNILKMIGVYYDPSKQARLPVLVLELMSKNLDTLLEETQDIPMYVKLSILQDVSRGVHYLHTLNPPVIHCDLSTRNILLTENLLVKICDFKSAKLESLDSLSEMTPVPGTVDFMSPEALTNNPNYGLPLDVFSFSCVVLHVICQKWPSPLLLYDSFSYETTRRHVYISQISDGSLKRLVISCLNNNPERRPIISQVYASITSILQDHYSNDNNIKMAYSLAMKDGLAEPRDLQMLLVGAENTGKTCLISSFLGEKYVEGQAATEAVEVDVCRIYCKDWTRISDSEKTNLLHHQFVDQLKGEVVKETMPLNDDVSSSNTPVVSLIHEDQMQVVGQSIDCAVEKMVPPTASVSKVSSSSISVEKSIEDSFIPIIPVVESVDNTTQNTVSIVKSADDTLLTTYAVENTLSTVSVDKSGGIVITPSVTASPPGTTVSSRHLPEPHSQDVQEFDASAFQYDPDSLNLSLWDFPGQVIFHNTHSVFISESGVVTITFNASIKLTSKIDPRKGSPLPPECTTVISSIHYWLQVVDSMCSVEGKEGDLSPLQPAVILAGTHIDLLDPDISVARKIAKEMILPQLIEQLSDKHYAKHLVGMGDGIEAALQQFCFFISNKCRDKEIERLKSTAVKAATSLKNKQPIYFLKIEQALLQRKEQVISKSKMAEIIAKSTFPVVENGAQFKGILKYFHEKRVILYFSQIQSLQDLVVLSPRWLARLFSYIITAHSYKRGKGFDEAWKRLTKYGILHEGLLQHMLDKFHSDYPSIVKVSKDQVVDILLCFHLVARITREAWFSEEGYPSLPDSGHTFIVPSLVPYDDRKNPPNATQDRIIYFKFDSGFIPTSLLNQLIADCVCRNVQRKNRLLWMRHGKVGLQLGAHQKYYISRCEVKSSIQLTITMPVKDDVKSGEERRELIDDITRILDNIMKVFMPAVKKKPVPLVPCPKCSTLHITLDEVCSGNTIFCPESGDADIPPIYSDLLPNGHHVVLSEAKGKLEVLTNYYAKLSVAVPFKEWSHHFVSARIITNEDNQVIQTGMQLPSQIASRVLDRIHHSLKIGMNDMFDKFLSILEHHGDMTCIELADQMRGELSAGEPTAQMTPNLNDKMATVTVGSSQGLKEGAHDQSPATQHTQSLANKEDGVDVLDLGFVVISNEQCTNKVTHQPPATQDQCILL